MDKNANPLPRVIGLDGHPDTFTAALLQGSTPAAAVTEKIFNQVPLAQLPSWAKKHTTPQDLLVLEASGNSFQVVRALEALGRKALVLESCQMGKLKEAHANNDKISAVRIGKAYLAGTAKTVWVPDPKTQERRDWFHAHRKAVKRSTQMRNRLLSYLSDNGVRLKKGTPLAKGKAAEEQLGKTQDWTPRQWQVIEGMLMELRHADEQRSHWRSLIAQEVLADPQLLSIVRLCGAREKVAFALGALIGDIARFAQPRQARQTHRTQSSLRRQRAGPMAQRHWGAWTQRFAQPADRIGPVHFALQRSAGAMGQKTVATQGASQTGGRGDGPQAGGGRLVSDDGPLDGFGGN